ncbi:MAG: cytochrome c [Phyllobacteriaceae bacterium]|nr:cytochrome c [Phyllobacteriaceae bacterium]
MIGGRTFGAGAAVLVFLLTSGAAMAADGVAARGEVLAKRWCASCHVVAADQTRASSDAPSFFALTGEAARTPEALAAYLAQPETVHGKMPDLHLSRVEIADIVAYVETLKP